MPWELFMKSVFKRDHQVEPEKYDTIYYDYKLAKECSKTFVADIVEDFLKSEFSEFVDELEYYELLKNIVIDKLCTMQAIKNVLSYKEENGIREIHDVNFNNGEVELTCLI